MYGPGDYEFTPRTDHPNDPRNDDTQEKDDTFTTPEILASIIYDQCADWHDPMRRYRINTEDLDKCCIAQLFSIVINADEKKALAARFILMQRLEKLTAWKETK